MASTETHTQNGRFFLCIARSSRKHVISKRFRATSAQASRQPVRCSGVHYTSTRVVHERDSRKRASTPETGPTFSDYRLLRVDPYTPGKEERVINHRASVPLDSFDMPRAARQHPAQHAQFHRTPTPRPDDLSAEDDIEEEEFIEEVDDGVADDDILDAQDGGADSSGHDRAQSPPLPPPGLKEISSLASWTVSSSKPGCGVAALRNPSTAFFWQSDGPQPHYLDIHFFKIVSILAIKIYLDFELDESYTPTLIRFAAGTGYNDLQVWSEMRTEAPRGWQDVSFEGVGDAQMANQEFDDEDSEILRVNRMPALRCMLLQVRICENHQNGKDTHLRGLQIFAKDEEAIRIRKTETAPATLVAGRQPTAGREILPVRPKGIWNVNELISVPTLR